MIADNLESVLKESMLAEPSAKMDAAILSAIRFRAKRNKRWRSFMPPMSIAAAFAILLVTTFHIVFDILTIPLDIGLELGVVSLHVGFGV